MPGSGKTIKVSPEEYDNEYFHILSRRYIMFDLWTHLRVSDVLMLLRPKPGEKILDIGCGWGTFSIECAKRKASVIGIDYSVNAIRCAKNVSKTVLGEDKTNFLVSEAARLSFKNATFDKLIIADLAEHIAQNDFKEMLKECSRVIKKGGELCIYTPNSIYFDPI